MVLGDPAFLDREEVACHNVFPFYRVGKFVAAQHGGFYGYGKLRPGQHPKKNVTILGPYNFPLGLTGVSMWNIIGAGFVMLVCGGFLTSKANEWAEKKNVDKDWRGGALMLAAFFVGFTLSGIAVLVLHYLWTDVFGMNDPASVTKGQVFFGWVAFTGLVYLAVNTREKLSGKIFVASSTSQAEIMRLEYRIRDLEEKVRRGET